MKVLIRIILVAIVLSLGYYFFSKGDDVSDVQHSAMELEKDEVLHSREEATETFTGVIEANENNDTAYFYRGIEKLKLDDYQGALNDYTKTIEINPKFTEAYYARAIIRTELNDTDEAITDYCKAIELDNDYLEVYVHLANLYHDIDNKEEELKVTEAGLDICRKGSNSLYYLKYGYTFLEQEKYDKSIEIFTEGLNKFPDDKDLYYNRGTAYLLIDDRGNALVDLLESQRLGHEGALDMLNYLHSL